MSFVASQFFLLEAIVVHTFFKETHEPIVRATSNSKIVVQGPFNFSINKKHDLLSSAKSAFRVLQVDTFQAFQKFQVN